MIARVVDESRFKRTELRDAVTRTVAENRPRWRVEDPADLELWVLEHQQAAFVAGLRLSDTTMRQHGGRAAERSGALRPVVAAAMVNLAGDDPGRLLDPCCGSGTILQEAFATGWEVVGSDVDPDAVAVARDNVPRAAVDQADVLALPHDDASFDAVVSNLPFGRQFQVDDPARWLGRALSELNRVTRPGRRVVLLRPAAGSPWTQQPAPDGQPSVAATRRVHPPLGVRSHCPSRTPCRKQRGPDGRPFVTRKIAFVAAVADGNNAVGSRIGAFVKGFTRRGWDVRVIDPHRPCGTRTDRLLEHVPTLVRHAWEQVGVEGDVRPATGWRARRAVRDLDVDVAVVSVPPFSLVLAGLALDADVGLVVDYRDPWNAREHPLPLARATRMIERRALRRASAVVYAGGPVLGDLLVRRLGLRPHQVISVPNGFNPNDVAHLNPPQARPDRDGQPLDLVMSGYWYGRNGPGILLDALERVGPRVVRLDVIGGVVEPIASRLCQATGRPVGQHIARSHREIYERLQRADAAVVSVDHASAAESRIPAKIYDYLATGVPIIAISPLGAALRQLPEARRFHNVDHLDVDALARLLMHAYRDRTVLRVGTIGAGPRRDHGVDTLHTLLRGLLAS